MHILQFLTRFSRTQRLKHRNPTRSANPELCACSRWLLGNVAVSRYFGAGVLALGVLRWGVRNRRSENYGRPSRRSRRLVRTRVYSVRLLHYPPLTYLHPRAEKLSVFTLKTLIHAVLWFYYHPARKPSKNHILVLPGAVFWAV